MSATSQPISIANTASAISSPAPLPTMPQPRTRSRLGVDQPFGQAVGDAQCLGTATGRPGIDLDLDFATVTFGFVFGQTRPGDFGIGEDDRGNGDACRMPTVCRQSLRRQRVLRASLCAPASGRPRHRRSPGCAGRRFAVGHRRRRIRVRRLPLGCFPRPNSARHWAATDTTRTRSYCSRPNLPGPSKVTSILSPVWLKRADFCVQTVPALRTSDRCVWPAV